MTEEERIKKKSIKLHKKIHRINKTPYHKEDYLDYIFGYFEDRLHQIEEAIWYLQDSVDKLSSHKEDEK